MRDLVTAVEAMLDELHPLTGERAVLAQMARQLAAILDGMEASVAARWPAKPTASY